MHCNERNRNFVKEFKVVLRFGDEWFYLTLIYDHNQVRIHYELYLNERRFDKECNKAEHASSDYEYEIINHCPFTPFLNVFKQSSKSALKLASVNSPHRFL